MPSSFKLLVCHGRAVSDLVEIPASEFLRIYFRIYFSLSARWSVTLKTLRALTSLQVFAF